MVSAAHLLLCHGILQTCVCQIIKFGDIWTNLQEESEFAVGVILPHEPEIRYKFVPDLGLMPVRLQDVSQPTGKGLP